MTNNEWIDSQDVGDLLELFYGLFYAIDGRFDQLNLTVYADENWRRFYEAFSKFGAPVYAEYAADDRINDWFRSPAKWGPANNGKDGAE